MACEDVTIPEKREASHQSKGKHHNRRCSYFLALKRYLYHIWSSKMAAMLYSLFPVTGTSKEFQK
jgi:hypothetical protein